MSERTAKMVRAWGLEPGDVVRFKNKMEHPFKSMSKHTLRNGKRKLYFHGLLEPVEVGFDTMVEVVEMEGDDPK